MIRIHRKTNRKIYIYADKEQGIEGRDISPLEVLELARSGVKIVYTTDVPEITLCYILIKGLLSEVREGHVIPTEEILSLKSIANI